MPSHIVVTTCQAATLAAASNVLAQITKSYKDDTAFAFDIYELIRFVALSFITAPPNYKWQVLLERSFPAYPQTTTKPTLPLTKLDAEKRRGSEDPRDNTAKPKLSIKNTLIKWFIDCMTVGALMNTAAFLVLMGLMKGQPREQIYASVMTNTIPLILTSYRVWPIVSIINFSFVPVERRIVFLSTVGLLWGVYMSLVAARV